MEYINKPEKKEKQHIILGIDLGTTNSSIGIWRNNTYEIIPDEYGNKTIPSYVSFTNIAKYVGLAAKLQKDINVENVFHDIKRLIGRLYNDPNVRALLNLLNYKIIENERGTISIQSTIKDNKIFSPEEISACVLMQLKENAQAYLKCEVKDVIITIPANFNDAQRQATKDAALIAGLNCIRTIHEPTAAALAYGMVEKTHNKSIKIIVYDFGGGTLDVNLIDICDGIFEVLCTAGITHLGGVDFDNRLINFCFASFSRKYSLKLDQISKISIQKLRLQCETAKKTLSTNMSAIIMVNDFYDNKDLCVKIKRDDFENLCRDLFLLALYPINDIFKECNMTEQDIDEVILVGGMTRMPYIREMLNNRFRTNNKSKINCSINPDEAITIGAAIQGYLLFNKDDPFSDSITLMDITPLSLGIEISGGIMDVLIKRNTMIPCEKTKLYTTDTDFSDSILIKIFEGERILTNHNFKIGEFELNKIPIQQKGMPEIEITFAIDINGIVTVTALEKNINEPVSIIVNTNKNGLKPYQLEALIDEAREQETIDTLYKIKKNYYYEIKDICSNILKNIKEHKFTENNIQKTTDELNIIYKWLDNKSYKDYEIEEYNIIINKLKTTYGMLVLQGETKIVSGFSEEVNATTIYGNNDDDDELLQAYEKVSKQNMTQEEISELKTLKQSLIELCTNSNTIANNAINEQKQELLHYIDDVLVWYYSHENQTKNDYIERINNINLLCEKLIFETSEIKSETKECNSQQLETLCLTLITLINNNQIKGPIVSLFKYKLNNILKYVLNTENTPEYQTNCYEHIITINEMCNQIYETNAQSTDVININTQETNNTNNTNNNEGMSILELMRLKQNEELEDILNKN